MSKFFKNIRINPVTLELDYYFPMEIMDPADKEYARQNGLEVGKAMLGFRTFEAIMVPCKTRAYDANGREVYLDTPSDEQRRIYKALIKEELSRQEEMKQDGRCDIPAVNGGLKKCPLRIPNPDYVPGGDQPKTLAKKCDGCPYERFKQAHTVIELSCLDHEGEDGEMEAYEVPAPRAYYAGDLYEELAEEFVDFIKTHKPKLAPLAEKLVQEYKLSDASKELGKSTSTSFSQKEKLRELLTQFLDNAILF